MGLRWMKGLELADPDGRVLRENLGLLGGLQERIGTTEWAFITEWQVGVGPGQEDSSGATSSARPCTEREVTTH